MGLQMLIVVRLWHNPPTVCIVTLRIPQISMPSHISVTFFIRKY
jgi:hypothetical protein